MNEWELTDEEIAAAFQAAIHDEWQWTAEDIEPVDRAIADAAVKKAIDFALRGPHMVAIGNDGSDVLCIECDWISTMRQEVGL